MSEAARQWAAAVAFLLRSDEPAIRVMTRRDLLGEPVPPEESAAVLSGPKVAALLSGQPDSFQPGPGWRAMPGARYGFGVNAYRKWTGAHWRLVSLAELEIPAGEPRALAAAEQVLGWLASPQRLRRTPVRGGLPRRCGSIDGNALAACCRLGLATDDRVRLLADSLRSWQWPDGGWNCDLRATGRRSSFHESLIPAWGLHEYALATGDQEAGAAARRAAELFLSHRLFRSTSTGQPISAAWLVPHYPPYWHYDIFQGLHILARLGYGGDERMADAADILERARRADGTWQPGGYWWWLDAGRAAAGSIEVVDWGRSGPNEMLTLNALRVLRALRRQPQCG